MWLSQVGQFNLYNGFLHCGQSCKFETQEKQGFFHFFLYSNIIYFIAYVPYQLQDVINAFISWQIQYRRWLNDTVASSCSAQTT